VQIPVVTKSELHYMYSHISILLLFSRTIQTHILYAFDSPVLELNFLNFLKVVRELISSKNITFLQDIDLASDP